MSSLSTTYFAPERGFPVGNQPSRPELSDAKTRVSTDASSEKRLLGSVLSFGSSLVAGFVIGYGIDAYYGTSPYWTVGLGVSFTALGIYQLIKEIRR